MVALRALPLELLATMGAQQKVRLYALMAGGAHVSRVHLPQQCLLLERAFVGLGQGLAGAEDVIEAVVRTRGTRALAR